MPPPLSLSQFVYISRRGRARIFEERDEPYGETTSVRNPHWLAHHEILVYCINVVSPVYLEPRLDSPLTGEVEEVGALIDVSATKRKFVPAPCCRCRGGLNADWLQKADGSGWLLSVDPLTGYSSSSFVKNRGSVGYEAFRSLPSFEMVGAAPYQLRLGPTRWPCIWRSGEVVMPGESVLMDTRFKRVCCKSCGVCCKNRATTFLHLADGRGWVAVRSRELESDDDDGVVDGSPRNFKYMGKEEVSGKSVGKGALLEYECTDDVEIFTSPYPVDENRSGFFIPKSTRVLTQERRLIKTGRKIDLISLPFGMLMKCKQTCRGRNLEPKAARSIMSFLKLPDGCGWISTTNSNNGMRQMDFVKLHTDDAFTSTKVHWCYVATKSIPVQRARTAASRTGIVHMDRESFVANVMSRVRSPTVGRRTVTSLLDVSHALPPIEANTAFMVSKPETVATISILGNSIETVVAQLAESPQGSVVGEETRTARWVNLNDAIVTGLRLLPIRKMSSEGGGASASKQSDETSLGDFFPSVRRLWRVKVLINNVSLLHLSSNGELHKSRNALPDGTQFVSSRMKIMRARGKGGCGSSSSSIFEVDEGQWFPLVSLDPYRVNGEIIELITSADSTSSAATRGNPLLHDSKNTYANKKARAGVVDDLFDRGTLSEWFYSDVDDESVTHGPFTLHQLSEWLEEGHFELEKEIRMGEDGDPVALGAMCGWFYLDATDPSVTHGPFTLHQLSEWLEEGHFELEKEIRMGVQNSSITLGSKFGWFYLDDSDASMAHGPYTLEQLREWLDDGHFERDMQIRKGQTGEFLALGATLALKGRLPSASEADDGSGAPESEPGDPDSDSTE